MMISPSKLSDPHSCFRKFTLQLLLVIIACVVSYFWIDRPLAILMNRLNRLSMGSLGNYNLTDNLTTIAYGMILIVMAFYAYIRLIGRQSTTLIATAGGISFAVPIAFFIKTQLQSILGRMPVRNGATLIFVKHPKAYGLQFFAGGGSFPSGHMCVFTACLLMVSYHYPKLKFYIITALSLLGFILIFDDYHFLSDVIAGAYLGYIIAKVTFKLET